MGTFKEKESSLVKCIKRWGTKRNKDHSEIPQSVSLLVSLFLTTTDREAPHVPLTDCTAGLTPHNLWSIVGEPILEFWEALTLFSSPTSYKPIFFSSSYFYCSPENILKSSPFDLALVTIILHRGRSWSFYFSFDCWQQIYHQFSGGVDSGVRNSKCCLVDAPANSLFDPAVSFLLFFYHTPEHEQLNRAFIFFTNLLQ